MSRTPSLLALLLGAALAAACGQRPAALEDTADLPAARHLILITADTWRGDHALTTVAGQALTPHLADFARRARVFTAAQSVSNCTSPGTAGLLTGLLPGRSAVIRNVHVLPAQVPTLATRLRAQGFRTAAVVTNPVLAAPFGFGRGFESYRLLRPRPGDAKARAPRANRVALEWLDAQPEDERLLLWVHYMEPHGPYRPPAGTLARFPVERFEAPRDVPLQPQGTSNGRGAIPDYQQVPDDADPHDGREYLARYAAEVAALDEALGELLDGLEQRGLLDDALVIISADHGEALAGDHGCWFSHQNGLTQDQVHVPLLLAWPGGPAGEVSARPVSTLDVLPTALELLGLPAADGLDGHSLLDGAAHPVYGRIHDQRSVRAGDWKLTEAEDGTATLIDLGSDPGETTDRSADRPDQCATLRDALGVLDEAVPLAEPVSRVERAEAGR